jgi:hypothetical protein
MTVWVPGTETGIRALFRALMSRFRRISRVLRARLRRT